MHEEFYDVIIAVRNTPPLHMGKEHVLILNKILFYARG